MILFLPKEELLTFDEITTIAKVYAELGVKKLKLLVENLYYDVIYIN